jgi:transcriptional regulator with XRE-family HTH domain
MNATTLSAVPARSRMPFAVGILVVPITALGLGVGTGGSATLDYVKERGIRGYPFAVYDSSRKASEAVESTPTENLRRIRAVLKPTVTDLAGLLGVSRQAIYDWQAGKPIASENASHLADLARAADVFAVEGLTGASQVLRRSIRDGKNFFALVKEGNSADGAARTLVEIVRRESSQRQALRKRLAGRPRPEREAFEEIGAPMLDERG